MAEDFNWEFKLKKAIADIENIRDGHKLEYSMLLPRETDLSKIMAKMHFDKYKAYDFVVRKLKREFDFK